MSAATSRSLPTATNRPPAHRKSFGGRLACIFREHLARDTTNSAGSAPKRGRGAAETKSTLSTQPSRQGGKMALTIFTDDAFLRPDYGTVKSINRGYVGAESILAALRRRPP